MWKWVLARCKLNHHQHIITWRKCCKLLYHSFINHSTCKLKVNDKWNVLARCKTVDVNALDHKIKWLKCRDAWSVKHSAHKHKIHVCKVCLKWKTENVDALNHEWKCELKRYPSSTHYSIYHHKHMIAKERGRTTCQSGHQNEI